MELLGTCYACLLQLILDRRARELFDHLSGFLARQVYQGYGYDLASRVAKEAVRQIAELVTGTITVAAVFPNPDHLLRPGQYGRVRAAVDVSRRALLVPQGAVFERQGLSRVAVVGPDSRVEIRAVRTGDRVGVLWVIEDGLAPGERVIVKGLQDVKAGSVVLPRPVKAESDVPAEQDGRRRAG